MRRILTFVFSALALSQSAVAGSLHFNESVLPYNGGFLVSQYGTETSNPGTEELKGSVLFYKDGKSKVVINQGILNAPTAMAVVDNQLFVCDRDKVWVFDQKNTEKPIARINFAEDDKAVNDIVRWKDCLYVTVTNTNRIYRIDLKRSHPLKAQLWLKMPSPNGLTVFKDRMYVVSIPSDYSTVKPENVVYEISDLEKPRAVPFNSKARLYDGVCVSEDGSKIFVSDWQTQSVIAIDAKTKKETTVLFRKGMTPADIAIEKNQLIVPDMMNHSVIVYDLKTKEEKIFR